MTETWIDHNGVEQTPGSIRIGAGLWLRRLGDDGFELSDFDPATTTTTSPATTTAGTTTTAGATTTEGATTTGAAGSTCGVCGDDTPATWSVSFGGFQNCFDGLGVYRPWADAFNGSHTLTPYEAWGVCAWRWFVQTATYTAQIRLTIGTGTVAVTAHLTNLTGRPRPHWVHFQAVGLSVAQVCGGVGAVPYYSNLQYCGVTGLVTCVATG